METQVLSSQIKSQAHEKAAAKANPTKTQVAAENDVLPLTDAGGAPIEVSSKVPPKEALTEAEPEEAAKAEAEAEAKADYKETTAAAATDEALTKAAGGARTTALSSNTASLIAASMLAQICERAFMEHQLAARHFTFYSFCKSILPSSM